ncbi:MAG: hypothetical protein JXA09_02770 [Anaerolineae bacterium]|nr:hypothetical protein [Anaerolineae bacterium]
MRTRASRLIVGLLGLVALIVLVVVGAALNGASRSSTSSIPVTLTALARATSIVLPSPTPVPTLPGVSEELLICQRELGQAMNARSLVGAVNLSDDHALLMTWISTEWPVRDLTDALPGIIASLDAALEAWEGGCALYDRVRIQVYDGPRDAQVHRLTVQVASEDLLKWRAGEYPDRDLLLRLQVTQPPS